MKAVLFRLIICLSILPVLESCSIFGIEKVIIRQSVFTHTEDDVLFKGKLYSISVPNAENITFPVYSKVPALVTMNRPYAKPKSTYRTVEYQPTILFLTNERFLINMGCTVYGKISEDQDNSFDILYIEHSNDCRSKEFSKIETLVLDALNASKKCRIENGIIYFKRNDKLMMVYNVI